jgi:signal transduction histidine kinase/CheY-like chemotaxis protein
LSIRVRLLIIALLAVLLPAVWALLRFQDDRRTQVAADAQRLATRAQDTFDEIAQRVRATAQLHYGLARAGELSRPDRRACSAFLSEVREAHPQYTGILTIRPDGRLFCDSLNTGRELDLNDRGYFRRALAAPSGVVLEPTFGRLTGRAVLQVAHPARAGDGSLQFVLLASLDLARVLPAAAPPGRAPRLLLLDDKGVVLAVSAGSEGGLKPGASLAGTPLGRFAEVTSATTTQLQMPDGTRQVWARADVAGLPEAGLRVLAGLPEADIVAAADQRFRRDAAWYAALAMLLFGAVWLMADRAIRQPLARMTGMAGRLAGGELAARVPEPLPGGELGVLATALNQAASSIETQRADIEALHTRLLQSQRLEAVGQLTGGVAHDFNNLLTVVLGNADLLRGGALDEPVRAQALQMLTEAAERGAGLTRQLLAFARKQPLAPGSVDVNPLVAALEPMLRRTLGEHIEIELVRGAGVWPALVDAGQLENALLNLCLNARDAMPRGGRLTLETANAALDPRYAEAHAEVTPGQYTMLAVSDTGNGISREHLKHVFEPFFTTKEKGKGTGLGLAMVYGFVKQSGGHVSIYSEPGQGTTVKIYLPRAEPARASAAVAPVPAPLPPAAGGAIVLLVEDDEPVRILAGLELRAMGYQVLEAASGAEALALLREPQPVDLLFTDVVMPGGMSGRELADAALQLRPALPVLFTSGYTENAVVHHGRLDPGVMLLQKPYRRDDLARAVRAALERGAATSP